MFLHFITPAITTISYGWLYKLESAADNTGEGIGVHPAGVALDQTTTGSFNSTSHGGEDKFTAAAVVLQ